MPVKLPSQTIGERIKCARIAAGLSQIQLAHALGHDPSEDTSSYISRLEAGKVNVKLDTLRKLATALGVELAELLG